MGSLNELKTTPMSIEDLRKFLPKNAKAVLYKTLSSSKKDVFSDHDCVVVLYETKINNKKQGHYISLIDRGGYVEYFSSLGKGPTVELSELELKETNKFKQILGNNYRYSKIMLQNQANYTINDCGLFCIARILLKNKKLRDFVKILKTKPKNTDDSISLMSLLLVNFVHQKSA